MKAFQLVRTEDVSGVSGIGVIAEGVEFLDGKVILHWNNHGTLGIFDDVSQVIAIHGHDGRTTIQWLSDSLSTADMREVYKRLSRDPRFVRGPGSPT